MLLHIALASEVGWGKVEVLVEGMRVGVVVMPDRAGRNYL